ncbi:unnamed protein product, partial [Ectocarpus sp. 4 AP-2014]
GFKCTVYECPLDILDLGKARFCAVHQPMYGHLCAVTSPPCNQPHQPNRLSCAAHAHLENRWRYYKAIGG